MLHHAECTEADRLDGNEKGLSKERICSKCKPTGEKGGGPANSGNSTVHVSREKYTKARPVARPIAPCGDDEPNEVALSRYDCFFFSFIQVCNMEGQR